MAGRAASSAVLGSASTVSQIADACRSWMAPAPNAASTAGWRRISAACSTSRRAVAGSSNSRARNHAAVPR